MDIDPILYWNDVALEVHRRDFSFPEDEEGHVIGPQQGGPTRTSRALAIVHIAMYDAWNGAQATGKNYLGGAGLPSLPPALPPPATSPHAAVAGAATTVLKALFSNQADYIEERMLTFLATGLPSGSSAPTVAQLNQGILYGRTVANVLLTFRDGDGANAPEVYVGGASPGDHRPDPYNSQQGYLGPHWGNVTPFCVTFSMGINEYLDPPPSFTSQKYRQHFIEVREHGARQRRSRTPKQEAIGLYWGYDGAKGLGTPPRLYNQIVRVIAEKQGNTVDKNARLFALVNAGMADAGIVAWRAKYIYNLWRPVIGVREDDMGTGPTGLGTDSTAKGDPFWEPYGAPNSNRPGQKNFTPPFPAYPSGHATFGTVVFDLVRRFYTVTNDETFTFDFVSDELNGKTVDIDGSVRTFVKETYTLNRAIKDNLESRVWLGVHWRFDGDGGKQAGEKVAEKVITFFP
jgi:hypothetical protein